MSEKITSEMLRERFKVTPEKVQEAVRRLIDLYNPLYIYAFGSYVRRTHDLQSDFDVMVVVPEYKQEHLKMLLQGHQALFDIDMSIDIVLYDKNRFEERSGEPMSFCAHILKTGEKLYAAA